jgi:hypothetical protein
MIGGDEHTLDFLLAFDGRVHHLEKGYWLKFEIRKTTATDQRPHGLRYSFTLHDPYGRRLLGFDNAHVVQLAGAKFGKKFAACDHWHRAFNDEGRPYRFIDADTLLADFFSEVRRTLGELSISESVERVTEVTGKRKI